MGARLEIEDLTVEFGGLRAADGVSFVVRPGTTCAVVGESGSGKSVTALSVLGLHDPRVARVSGRILLDGVDLRTLPREELRRVRGGRVAMVFQDPSSSLDPSWRVGAQIAEAIRLHGNVPDVKKRVVELLALVGIPAPEERAEAYPHQLSGGMKQRVMIAIALACDPEILIADEPTTALDVTIQAQIVELLARLRRERGLSILLITHDLGLVAETADDVVVMYAGRVVERGAAADVLRAPRHPYTAGLLASTPVPGETSERLREIRGVVPDLRALPRGCRFADRCDFAVERCTAEEPLLETVGAPMREAPPRSPGGNALDGAFRCHFPLRGTP